MKKKQSIVSIISVFLIGGLLFCGCNMFFSPQNYLQTSLDEIYKGDTTAYAEMIGISEEEAEQDYQQGYQSEVDTFSVLYQVDPVSDAVRSRINDLYQQLYSMTSYTVGDDKTQDGVYTVQLTVSPIELFVDAQPSVEEYVANFNNNATNGMYNNISSEEYMDIYANGLLDIFFSALSNVRYGDPVELTVNINHDSDNNRYSISPKSISEIAETVIAYPTAVSKTAS